MRLVFATNNPHKVAEAAPLIGDRFTLVGLAEAGVHGELAETGDTLEANARQKAAQVWEGHGLSCFSEDTGLEVDALGGAPGVHTARYAGEGRDPGANMDKLLAALAGREDRRARFRTVIALVLDGRWTLFEGVCEGVIGTERLGEGGFGYDPVFHPLRADGTPDPRSFAQMGAAGKAALSHRGKAVRALVAHLRGA